MATLPRYLGATVAEAKTVLEEILTTDVYLRDFDMSGDGTVATDSNDEKALVRGICHAELLVDIALKASHGTPFTGTVPDGVLQIVAMLTPWCTMQWRGMGGNEKAPSRLLYNDGKALLKDLAGDRDARLPSIGAPQPVAALASVDDPPATPFADMAGGGTSVGF
ncbi:MAG: hypothetical protein Q8S73_36900 [Deltaproteobacteria bacterium]|nr:hypothetical protein [Myxococcales bacterium]MDP3219739.1 hypothetical protein [Deltaproteobacteria bacterium]